MNEEIEFIIDSAKEAMDAAIKHLEKQLVNIRAGKATPSMLGSVMVDYYGAQTPLNQVANVNTPDGRTISVQPWEKSMLQEIERGIMVANLGFNPMNNGETIIINVPPLTEERRKELAKQANPGFFFLISCKVFVVKVINSITVFGLPNCHQVIV